MVFPSYESREEMVFSQGRFSQYADFQVHQTMQQKNISSGVTSRARPPEAYWTRHKTCTKAMG